MATKYSQPWEDSDIVFVVDDEHFHCHYFLLKMCSPVFRVMFSGNFHEAKTKPTPLPGKEKEVFTNFLDYVYLVDGVYPILENDMAMKVLDLCDEYQVKSVKKHIDHMLYSAYSRKEYNPSNVNQLMVDLKMTEQYGLEEARDCICRRIVDINIGSYNGTVFDELSGDLKFKLLVGLVKRWKVDNVCILKYFTSKYAP